MTFKEQILVETKRLHELNPNICRFTREWLKLSATARVNVCRRAGVYNPVAEEVLQSHSIGEEANIQIVGMIQPPADQRQLTLF